MMSLLDRFHADWSQDKPPDPPNLTPTFYDLVTGNTRKSRFSASLFWWAEGNGSCDCNREEFQPDITTTHRTCGNERFIAVNFEADDGRLSVEEKDALCAALNKDYARAIRVWAKGCETCERAPQHMEHFPCKRRGG